MRAVAVPVKSLGDAKSRLHAGFDSEDVRQLVLAMAADVMEALANWELRIVIGADGEIAELADAFGFRYLQDPDKGLNAALELAATTATAAGASSLLIIPSDVPLVKAEDLASLTESQSDVSLVVSPDGGTNALKLIPPTATKPRFGPRSADAHRAAATTSGLSYRELLLPSLLLDVDQPSHVNELSSSSLNSRSVAVARRISGGRSIETRRPRPPDRSKSHPHSEAQKGQSGDGESPGLAERSRTRIEH